MIQNRSGIRVLSILMLMVGGLLTWWAGHTAAEAVNRAYAPYSVTLKAKNLPELGLVDVIVPHRVYRQLYPKLRVPATGQLCGSDCLARQTILRAQLVRLPLVWVGGTGAVLALLGGGLVVVASRPNPRRNLINYQRGRVQLPDTQAGSSLPIVQAGHAQWGLMRRDLRKGGRRELGNAFVIGAPGRGKSSILKQWLLTCDTLNFVVLDLKGDLWRTTAGHRSEISTVIRFDLNSLSGDAFDPLDFDDENRARAVISAFLPSNTGQNSDYFNALASEVAICYWRVARLTGQSAVAVLVRAATLHTTDMLDFTQGLIANAPPAAQKELLVSFRAAFGLLWDHPDANGERNSMIQAYKAAFASLNTPEILSTLCRTTFNPAILVEERATLYVSAPSTQSPYKMPIEALLGGIILAINHHVDYERDNQQGEDIVILADEAGILHVPHFSDTLAGGRSRGIATAAFFQTMGQLDQYHEKGWRGLVDNAHHWVWFRGNDPDAHEFMRQRCGIYDKPSLSQNAEERQRRPYVETYAYDELRPQWRETEVLALLDFDRTYVVFGTVVNPYQSRELEARMHKPTPPLDAAPAVPPVQLAAVPPGSEPLLPESKEALPFTDVIPPNIPEDGDDKEVF